MVIRTSQIPQSAAKMRSSSSRGTDPELDGERDCHGDEETQPGNGAPICTRKPSAMAQTRTRRATSPR